ncbi:MAG: hypothetical protein ACUVRZ_01340 [Desulfobacca sp.]|uniref:hypothetical protein n=1 Tax=Desulfobacca sp. TaxID=2067990 RepID=UPI00404AA336
MIWYGRTGGLMSPQPHDISLRPFPFPYRAALAIASDIDGCTPAAFLAVHRFLNIDLGLPVADSCFALGREPGQLAYFQADGVTPSPAAPLLQAAIQAGIVDSLHSWGDFNGEPPAPQSLRRLALMFTEHLQRSGLSLKIWINHGAPSNRQNFLSRRRPEFVGDDPASPYYTADLARTVGVQFYWGMELLPWPLSIQTPWARPAFWLRVGGNAIKNLAKFLLGRWRQRRRREQIAALAAPLILRDGWPLWAFNRFNYHPQGLWGRPNRHTLRFSLTPAILRQLVQEGGFLILYTHLGLPRQGSDPLFPVPDRQALEKLADIYQQGGIWVAPTARLLTYWQVRQTLRWEVRRQGDQLLIQVLTIADPLVSPRQPTATELAGLSFYSDRPAATKILLAGRELPSRPVPPDHTGRRGVMVPLLPPPATGCLEEKWPV